MDDCFLSNLSFRIGWTKSSLKLTYGVGEKTVGGREVRNGGQYKELVAAGETEAAHRRDGEGEDKQRQR